MNRALVVGLARSGRAAAALLVRHGFSVVAVDAADVEAAELVGAGVDVRAHWNQPVEGPLDLVVKSPGVPASATPVAAARKEGVPVISEIELAARFLSNPLIAITGTNGKTTTTELTAHLLREAGIDAVACGNQGTPICALADAIDSVTWLVVECSSFQLEDVGDAFRPRAAVLLNVTPDHLDRHASMQEYLAAKLRIFEHLGPTDLAIAPPGMAIPGEASPHTVDLDGQTDTSIAWGTPGVAHAVLGRVADWDRVVLRGTHNRQNVLVAVSLAAHAGADGSAIAAGLATFPGVAHRLEVVGELNGVTYVNDSKATNPDAAMAALDAYPKRVHLIAGGKAKGTPFEELVERAVGAVVHAYLIGDAATQLADAFSRGGVPATISGDMAAALAAAHEVAEPGDTVLLAPACTSFDQYPNFEARGAHFRSVATAMGVHPTTP